VGRDSETRGRGKHAVVDQKLPKVYQRLKHIFSKAEGNQLPPQREGIDHDIQITTEPHGLKASPLYSMSLEHLEELKRYLREHLAKGYIEPSDADFGAPVLFVKKANGKWRFCVDYRKLNAITKKDRYPLPRIDETMKRLRNAKYFTTIDIQHAFNAIRMKESAKDWTTFRTREGSYRYLVMPFGLCNGPSTYQRFINGIMMDILDDFVAVYVDDILIYSNTYEEHVKHVTEVLERLEKANLYADITKSNFHSDSVKFLGLVVGKDGLHMDQEKVAAIRDWKEPKSLKGLQSFLGFCNYYREFLPEFGRVARPLQKLTKKDSWRRFGEAEKEAFQKTKDLITSGDLLAHFSPLLPSRVETDASDCVCAGVFSQQQEDGAWKPVAFYSKAMSEAEMRYEIHDKEMLAVVEALKHWRDMLIGLQDQFLVITDHRALEYFSTKRLLNPRQARWQDLLSEFDFKLTYRPGSENIVADALSRKHEELRTQKEKDIAARTNTLINPAQICDIELHENRPLPPAQAAEPAPQEERQTLEPQVNAQDDTHSSLEGYELIDRVLHLNRSSPSLERQRQLAREEKQDWKLTDGRLTRFNRLMVPEDENMRTHLIAEAHNRLPSAHPGQRKTFHLLAPQYYWPTLRADCHTYVNNCRTCRRTHKPRDKTPGLLKPLPIGDRCWQHVQMDLHYMPKDKKGYDCVFVVVDRFGKRTFTLPCKRTIDAPGLAELYYTHIWRIYGAPETIVSDRGGQFISAFTNELCKLTGVKQHFASTYHAPTNGGVEIVNQYVDQRLRPFVNHYQDDWSDYLPAMDFAQATLKHESTGFAPYELELGFSPRLHFNWEERTREASSPTEQLTREQAQQYAQRNHQAIQLAKQNLEVSQKQMAAQANKTRREPDFKVGDSVYVTRKGWTTSRPSLKLDHQLAGPFRITSMKGNSYELDLPANMKVGNVFHADRLRKDPNNPLPGQLQEPEPPITINNEPEWTLDQILASRVYRGTLQYQASWSGYDPDNTWYPAENFIGSPHKVQEFHTQYPDSAGPPTRLQHWIDAYLKGDELEPCPEDNVAIKEGKKGRKRRHK